MSEVEPPRRRRLAEARHPGDLEEELRWFLAGVLRPNGLTLISTVLAEQVEQPELMAACQEHVVALRRACFRAVLDAAIERGELPAGAAVEEAVRALVGAVDAQSLDGSPFDPGWPRRMVALILDGLRGASRR